MPIPLENSSPLKMAELVIRQGHVRSSGIVQILVLKSLSVVRLLKIQWNISNQYVVEVEENWKDFELPISKFLIKDGRIGDFNPVEIRQIEFGQDELMEDQSGLLLLHGILIK